MRVGEWWCEGGEWMWNTYVGALQSLCWAVVHKGGVCNVCVCVCVY